MIPGSEALVSSEEVCIKLLTNAMDFTPTLLISFHVKLKEDTKFLLAYSLEKTSINFRTTVDLKKIMLQKYASPCCESLLYASDTNGRIKPAQVATNLFNLIKCSPSPNVHSSLFLLLLFSCRCVVIGFVVSAGYLRNWAILQNILILSGSANTRFTRNCYLLLILLTK